MIGTSIVFKARLPEQELCDHGPPFLCWAVHQRARPSPLHCLGQLHICPDADCALVTHPSLYSQTNTGPPTLSVFVFLDPPPPPQHTPARLFDPATPNGQAWPSAALLRIGDTDLELCINPPTVDTLSLQVRLVCCRERAIVSHTCPAQPVGVGLHEVGITQTPICRRSWQCLTCRCGNHQLWHSQPAGQADVPARIYAVLGLIKPESTLYSTSSSNHYCITILSKP